MTDKREGNSIMKWFFNILGIVLIGFSTFFCLKSNNIAGIVFLISGCIFICLAFVEELAHFISEINLKEGKILIKELKVAQQELQDMAINLTKLQLLHSVKHPHGNIVYKDVDYIQNQLPKDEKAIQNDVFKSLKALRIDDTKINNIRKEFNIEN